MFRGKRLRRGLGPRRLPSVLLLVVLAGLAASASAAATISLLPPSVETVFRGTVTPSKLPARGRAPVSLRLAEAIGKQDGSHPPALQELDVELDRHLGLSVEGLPRCGAPLQEHGPRTGTVVKCEDAKVGAGTIEVEVAVSEQQPVRTSGQVYVYNGGVSKGRTRFWLYTFISAPVAGSILMPLDVRRDNNGVYGWKGVLTVPKIANGSGSVTSLSLNFSKGIFSAGCPTGKLQQRADSKFVDGTEAAVAAIQHCRASD